MKIKILKFNGDEQVSSANKVELRKNQVAGWIRLNNDDVIDIKDIATIQICDDSGKSLEEPDKQTKADVIDEFVSKCKERIEEICLKAEDDIPFLDIFDIENIAKQMKG